MKIIIVIFRCSFILRQGIQAEHEACRLLKEQGWIVSRWSGNASPPDLFAARKGEILLVMVRYMRGPVRDAHAVSVAYGCELDRLRSVGDPVFVQKECWIFAPPDGWKYYEVLPGGIRRIWRRWGEAGIPETPDTGELPGPGGALVHREDTGDHEITAVEMEKITAMKPVPKSHA